MTQPHRELPHPRVSLRSKILGGFALIIIILVVFSIVVLYMLGSAFSPGQSEFRNFQLSQNLQKYFKAEHEAAVNLLESRDTTAYSKAFPITRRFQADGESLMQSTDRSEMRSLLGIIVTEHGKYVDFLHAEEINTGTRTADDSAATRRREQSLFNNVMPRIQSLNDTYQTSVSKTLRSLDERTKDAIIGACIILCLALVVAFSLAVMVARTLTKPIQALKAGTEKVAEGVYEDVPVTSNDEVADLTNAFNLMSDKLKQLDEMRIQLMREISHEMRTPLQVIKAGCYTILHAKDAPALAQRQRNAVGMIHQAANRINHFVNSFLDVAKMEAGLMKFNFEEIGLIELLTPLIQEAQLIAKTREITVELTTGELPTMMLDTERMGQVFSNLLSNALKYTPNNGSVTIHATRATDCGAVDRNGKGCVRIDVRDTGVGIPEADIEKLFSKFYQANNVPLVNEKGSGLGLALVKHVVEAHGGRVSVKSHVGEGSTFSVLLPL